MQAGALNMKFLADMTDLQRKFGQAQDMAQNAANRIGGFFTGVGARIAGALSVAGLAAFVQASIKAADEVGKISQRTGVAVQDLGGLQLAWRQSGASAEQFVPIMAKVSTAIASGNKALEAMGVQTRNTDGTLKSTRQVLGEVSDKFASYQDGAGKTALAVKLLGEEGAKALPFLNGGAKALDEYDEMARRLGLTLDQETTDKAAKFNDTLDLIGQSTQGIGRQIAAHMLPTLQGLADQFFSSMTEGDRLKNTAGFLSSALKGVVVVGLGVAEVFNSVGKAFGGLAAAAAAAASGNFSEAGTILRELKNDIGTGWKQTLNDMESAWNTTGSAGVAAMVGITRATPPAIEAAKKLGNEAKKAADEYNKWMATFEKANEERREKIFDARLAEQEKAEAAYQELVTDDFKANEERREKIFNQRLDAQEKAVKDAQDEYEKMVKAEEDAYVDMWRSVDETARDVFVSVADEGVDAFERIGKTLKAAVLDMLYQMTVRKWIFQIAGVDVGGMGGLGGGGGNLASSAMRTGGMGASNFVGNTVGGGNTGALVGGATGTMGYANVLGSMYANAATAGMATGSIASSGAGISALLSTNGAYGTAAAAGASAGASAGAAAGASAGTAGAASGLAAVPVWGWIALAVLALWEPMFGRKVKEIGKAGNFDGAGGIATSQYTHKQGGWFRSNKDYYDPLNDGGAFQRQLKGVQEGMIETARVMGLGEEAIRNFSGSININLKGLNAQEAAAKTKEEMTKLQAQMLATASFVPQVVQSFEQIEAAAIEMGMSAEDAARHAREVTARDDGLKRQGFEQMTNYYIGLINQTEEVMARAGITSQALADVITAGMTGRLDQSQVGAQLADIVLGGIYNTIAGGFAAQISDVFMQQIIQPIMLAVTAGVPLTTAISQQAMTTVVAQAQQSAQILSAIFADPVFQQTMAQLQTVISGISIAAVQPAKHIKAFGTAALGAGTSSFKAADQIKSAWRDITDNIIEEIRRLRGEVVGDTMAGLALAQSQFAIATAQARSGNKDAASSLPQLSRNVEELLRLNSATSSQFVLGQAGLLTSLMETAQLLSRKYKFKLPGFAVGTDYVPQDMLAMVHRGEQIIPPAYNPHANGNDQSMAAELQMLRAEVVGLRAEMRANVSHTSKAAKALDRALSPEGDAFSMRQADGATYVTEAA